MFIKEEKHDEPSTNHILHLNIANIVIEKLALRDKRNGNPLKKWTTINTSSYPTSKDTYNVIKNNLQV